jgi:hypothetical protein
MNFVLDREGGAEVLKDLVKDAISELALQVGAGADEGAKVAEFSQIGEYVSDRFVATVTVPAERQAKFGVLTRAALAAGLEVRIKTTAKRPRRNGTSK